LHRGGPEYASYTPLKRGPGMNSPVPINFRECPKKLPSLSQLTPVEEPECPKQLPTQAGFAPSPVPNNYPHIIYQSPSQSNPSLDDARTGPAAATPAAGRLPPPPRPCSPSPAVMWAGFSPSRPRQPQTTVVAVSPIKPDEELEAGHA
jgi:hypothetical protein